MCWFLMVSLKRVFKHRFSITWLHVEHHIVGFVMDSLKVTKLIQQNQRCCHFYSTHYSSWYLDYPQCSPTLTVRCRAYVALSLISSNRNEEREVSVF